MANNLKDLMGMSPDALRALGSQYGLSFDAGMKKSQMAKSIHDNAASGWLQENSQLLGYDSSMNEVEESNLFNDQMLSDAAHAAQMISSAGFTESFHAAMSGTNHHAEALNEYLGRLGTNADDVWMHMPRNNPEIKPRHWGELNTYMRDTLTGNQDIMPELPGHYTGDILGEYSTSRGTIADSYDYLSHIYVDKGLYNNPGDYQKDVARVSAKLASELGPQFLEVAASSAMGAKTSYMDILPQIGDSSIVGGIQHPRQPLNAAGLPLGSYGSAVGNRGEYSLTASLTGRADTRDGANKALYSDIAENMRSAARVYTGGGSHKADVGMNPYQNTTSERDMIMDSATRYVSIEDARSGYANQYDPKYNSSTIRSIIENDYDVLEAAQEKTSIFSRQNVKASIATNGSVKDSIATAPSSATDFIANFDGPTAFNAARDRRFAASRPESPIQFHDEMEQGSQEWLDFRKQYTVTGSSVGAMLGHEEYTNPIKQLGENIGLTQRAITPRAAINFERGHRLEAEARPRIASQYGFDIKETGAITNSNYPGMMYSPDGLIGDDALWEHKAPNQFRDLSSTPQYYDQMQLGMHLSGRNRTLFTQTVGDESRSQWVDKEEGWYESNKNKLDSILARGEAGRRFMEENSGLDSKEMISGARQAMTGEGIWAFDTPANKYGRQYSGGKRGMSRFNASAGTDDDEFLSRAAPNLSDTSPTGEDKVANSVKTGILLAQEENKRSAAAGGGGNLPPPLADADFDDAVYGSGGGGGRGGGGGHSGGYGKEHGGGVFDGGGFGSTVAEGISRGTMASTRSGFMQALREGGPVGQTAALAIGALGVGGEVISTMNDYLGTAQDYGSNNPTHFASMGQGLEMLGMNHEQATRMNLTTHSAYNTLLNGDPSGALQIVRGSRGLLTISDIHETQGDPVALARIARERGEARGWSQQRMAGAAQMSGLDGLARTYMRQDQQGDAERVVATRAGDDTSSFNASIAEAQAARAESSPDYFAPRFGTSQAATDMISGFSDGMVQAYRAADGAVSGAGEAYNGARNFVAGTPVPRQGAPGAPLTGGVTYDPNQSTHRNLVNATKYLESRGMDYDANGNPLTSTAGDPNVPVNRRARYAMQVLPSSARNPGYGIRPAASDTPEEYNRVGEDILEVMLKQYNGDWRKAASAYSDGAGTVNKAVKAGGEDWLNHMPQQAQKRVEDLEKAGFGAAGANAFSGTSVGGQTTINVEIKAQVNAQEATARVGATGANQTTTARINMNNGVAMKK